jgi:hypothetical protein
LSHCFASASKPAAQKSFDCCLSHFCTSISTSSSSAKRLPPSCELLYVTNTSHHIQERFIYEYPLQWVLLAIKMRNRTLLFGSTPFKHSRHFGYWNQPLNMVMYICYLRLSWSWTVLLLTDTHRKPITSSTADLLPFMTYLLTLPYIYEVPSNLVNQTTFYLAGKNFYHNLLSL